MVCCLDIQNIVLMAESAVVTWEELEKHIYSYDCWMLIEGGVYNVKDFLVEHPGGNDILVKYTSP
jgi:cytochrome b involved in lipid metabolism